MFVYPRGLMGMNFTPSCLISVTTGIFPNTEQNSAFPFETNQGFSKAVEFRYSRFRVIRVGLTEIMPS